MTTHTTTAHTRKDQPGMSQLDGRLVYTRAEQHQRTGRSLSYLEKLYRDRQDTGHPEPVATLNRANVWDAEEWDTWYEQWTDTTGLATLEELAEQVGRSRATLRKAWADRDSNHHPAPRKRLDGTDRWDVQEYVTWFTQTYLPSLITPRHINRSGHPDDLVTASEGSRSIGLDPSSTAKYKTRPPRGWPQPVPGAGEHLPGGGVREKYRLGDFWAYAEQPTDRTAAGRPSTDTIRRWPYDGDPRLTIARTMLTTTAAEQHPQLPKFLAQQHPPTPAGTWADILTTARKHPTD